MRVTVFAIVLAIILVLYGALHYYLFIKLQAVFPDQRKLIVVVLLLCGSSVFVAELLVHGNIQSSVVFPLVWFSFVWMGLVFLFFFVSLAFDIGGILVRLGQMDGVAKALASPQRTVWVVLLVMGIAAQGYWSARQINVEHITLVSPKLSHPIRIVQIADLHLGTLTDVRHLQRIVAKVNSLAPDIIVSTGDLVDMEMDHMQGLLQELTQLDARLGKYAIYGNHEVLAGIKASHDFITAAGFSVLSGSEIVVGDELNIAGVDDPMAARSASTKKINETELLKRHANGLYTVLLKHQPVINPHSVGLFDLQLSGHVHGGQIFPFGVLTWLVYRKPMGLSAVGKDAWLYVSRGTGTWGPPMRVLAPPEISLFDLRPLHDSELDGIEGVAK